MRQQKFACPLSIAFRKCCFLLTLSVLIFFTEDLFAQGNCPVCGGNGKCPTCNGTRISGRGNCHGIAKAFGCTNCRTPGQRGGACEGEGIYKLRGD